MRTIKFRAWDGIRMTSVGMALNNDNGVLGAYLNGVGGGNDIEMPIMQFTGLTDKNGVEIYENDIVKDGELALSIEFIQGSFCKCNENGNWVIHNSEHCEVIGNIHKNPTLL